MSIKKFKARLNCLGSSLVTLKYCVFLFSINVICLINIVTFTENAGAICLPVTSEQRNRDIENQTATIAGWGSTENGTKSPVLLSAKIQTFTNDACINIKYR